MTQNRSKLYILDTNVLVHNPSSLLDFQDNTVVIPIEVLEEIDKFKRESSDRGAHARAVSRLLDGFRTQGRLSDGVLLPNGGRLQVVIPPLNGGRRAVAGDNSVDARLVDLTRECRPQTRGRPPSSSRRTSTSASRPTRQDAAAGPDSDSTGDGGHGRPR